MVPGSAAVFKLVYLEVAMTTSVKSNGESVPESHIIFIVYQPIQLYP